MESKSLEIYKELDIEINKTKTVLDNKHQDNGHKRELKTFHHKRIRIKFQRALLHLDALSKNPRSYNDEYDLLLTKAEELHQLLSQNKLTGFPYGFDIHKQRQNYRTHVPGALFATISCQAKPHWRYVDIQGFPLSFHIDEDSHYHLMFGLPYIDTIFPSSYPEINQIFDNSPQLKCTFIHAIRTPDTAVGFEAICETQSELHETCITICQHLIPKAP